MNRELNLAWSNWAVKLNWAGNKKMSSKTKLNNQFKKSNNWTVKLNWAENSIEIKELSSKSKLSNKLNRKCRNRVAKLNWALKLNWAEHSLGN